MDLHSRIVSLSAKRITGWAYNADDPNVPVHLLLEIDGVVVRQIICNRFRDDISPIEFPTQKIGFGTSIPLHFWNGRTLDVSLTEKNTGFVIHQSKFAIPNVRLEPVSGNQIYGGMTDVSASRIAGWATDLDKILTVELEIDGVLTEVKEANDIVSLDEKRIAGFAFERFPFDIYDDSGHQIKIAVRSDKLVTVSETVVHFPAEAAPQFTGEVRRVSEGRLHGFGLYPADLNRTAEIALMIDGVERARTFSNPGTGDFSFDLTSTKVADWLTAEIAVTNTDGNLPLNYAGQHLVRDGLTADIINNNNGTATLFLSAPVPLPEKMHVEIEVRKGSNYSLKIDNHEGASSVSADIDGSVLTRNARIILNGLSLKTGGEWSPLHTNAIPEPTDREIGDFVSPLDRRVRQALTERVRQTGTVFAASGYSGGWKFEAPAEVRGWALDFSNSDPLIVALLIDGAVVALAQASDRVVVREAGFRFETPTGFRFDLATFASMDGIHVIDVCVMPGNRQLHGSPVEVNFDTLSSIASLESRIDSLVFDDSLAQAYLVARSARYKGRAGISERLHVLDFVLRTEWRNYESVLSTAEHRLSEQISSRLRDAARGITAEPLNTGTTGLPIIYDNLVTAVAKTRASGITSLSSVQEQIERYSLWKTLQALPESNPSEANHNQVSIIITHDQAGNYYEKFYCEAANAGCHVFRAAQIREALIDTGDFEGLLHSKVVIVLREPRLIGISALGYWPALFANLSGHFRINSASVLVGNPHDPDLEFAGYFEDSSVSIFASPTREVLMEALNGTESETPRSYNLTAFKIVTPDEIYFDNAPILLYNPNSFDIHPPVPPAYRVLPIEFTKIGDVYSALLDLKQASPVDQLVLVLDSSFHYPEDYLEETHRNFVLYGSNTSVINTPIKYDPMKQRFYFEGVNAAKQVFVGHIALGGYRISDLLESATRHGTGGGIVVATTRPFAYNPAARNPVTGDLTLASRKHFKLEASDIFELQKGFIGNAFANWTGSFRDSHGKYIELDDASFAISSLTHSRSQLVNGQRSEEILEKIAAVVDFGRPDIAREAVYEFVSLRAVDGQVSEQELHELINIAKRLGLREEVVRRLGFRSLFAVSLNADLIIPMFEMLAVVLPTDQLTAAITSATAMILRQPNNKSLYRIVDVARRYSNAEIMTMIVNLISSSGHGKIFSEDRFAGIVGEALIGSAISSTAFVNNQYGLSYFVSRAPIKAKIKQAVQSMDAGRLCTEINRYFAEGRDTGELILLLRTYSNEISDIGLAAYGIRYPHKADRDQRLALAIIFDDTDVIARHEFESPSVTTTSDSLAIAAATYRNDFSLLKSAFAAWTEGQDIVVPDFGGTSIHALFERMLFNSQINRAAPNDYGKVSIIVTVYNPDLVLLELALRSVLAQTYSNIEIILVDDASNEVSNDAIAGMAAFDSRIRFIRLPRNSGPYICRNEALKVATGDFVAIQDGDDFSHPQRIEIQVGQLASCSIYQMCTTAHLRIDRRARLQFEHDLSLRGDGTMTSMFRREVFDVIGPFMRVRSRGDVEFRQRILKSYGGHTTCHVEIPMVFCFAAPSSLSNTIARTQFDYLAAFRASIDATVTAPVLSGLRQVDRCIDVEVPWPMRPI